MENKKQYLNNLKIAFLTLGCKVNQYETDGMIALLEKEGCNIVDFQEQADVYVVNTCSVTNMADRKSRQMLHRAKKLNPDAIVVAAGCYVQADKEHVLEDYAVDLVLGNNVKKNIVELLTEYYQMQETPYQEMDLVDGNASHHEWSVIDIGKTTEYEELKVEKQAEMTRAYVKVQDGCNQFCSYCIIPYTRGRVRSRQMGDVLEEVARLVENGFKEVILTGIHLSSYGVDHNTEKKSLLLNLIQEIAKIEGIERIRLGSLEPGIITDEFLKEVSKIAKFCPHFHLSLQSACNETLKRMNRKYTIEEYMDKCNMIRKYFSLPAITTDVIVGFPGETEEEFAATVRNLRDLNLYEMHVFKFSPRKGTVAASMKEQIPEQIKTERSEVLLAMTREHQEAFEDAHKGQVLEVLIEELVKENGKSFLVGHTANYIKVKLKADENLCNTIVKVLYNGPEAEASLVN